MIGYTVSNAPMSFSHYSQWHRVWKSRKTKSCNFRTNSYKFRKGKIMGARRFQFAPYFPIIEDHQRQNSPKWAKVARKLRSMAKIAQLHKYTKVEQKLRSTTSQFSGGLLMSAPELILHSSTDFLLCLVTAANCNIKVRQFYLLLHWCFAGRDTPVFLQTFALC